MKYIVDDRKKDLWVSYSHKGGSHDSSYFRDTELYSCLETVRDELFKLGYYILGDSAYAIESFLFPTYIAANPRRLEDNFNVYHSSARITLECVFGEFDLKYCIFLKILTCSLSRATLFIEGAMRLQNFLLIIVMSIQIKKQL